MAATMNVVRLTGSGPTATDITSINSRANAEDAHSTAGTTNGILKPTSGTNYSYWVTERLSVASGSYTSISNLKFYTDGTNSMGTGRTCKVNTASSYVQATGTAGTTGTQLTTGNHGGLAGAPSDIFAYTSGSPLSVTGSASSSATGQFGDRVVWQTEIGTTASTGAGTAETFTWQWDEV